MKQPRPGVKLRIAILGLSLLLLAGVAAACAPATPASPPATAPAPAAQPTLTASPSAAVKAGPVAPTVVAAKPAKSADVPMGVDADGNFYRGDPKAPVKLTEFSDFQ